MWQIPKYLRIRLLMEEREDGDWERLDYMIHAEVRLTPAMELCDQGDECFCMKYISQNE